MKEEERRLRGSSFGSAAQAYAEHRPDYPQAAVRWALEPAGTEIAGLRVLDLGAGTGKLTAVLAALGTDVTAVEPDPAMLAELRHLLPGVRALSGGAEAIPVPDGSADAVLCGQAMHWFNMAAAIPEIARVLVPGGPLAGLWNSDDDDVEWVAGLARVTRGVASPSPALSNSRARAAGHAADRFGLELFGPAERAAFPHAQRRTAASLVAQVGTHSKVLVMPEAGRQRLLADVAAYLASRPETADGEFMLPIRTTVVRAVRRQGPSAGPAAAARL